MKLEIKQMNLKSFKGASDQTIKFDGNTKIKGCNGAGKTTIMCAAMWCLSDVDSKLVKNPDVVPMGSEECSPTVEIEFALDGKPLTVCKQQKFKKKEVDGKITSSVTNSYSINGIEKSFKAFNEDLMERGIDVDNFLYLSHPDAFTSDVSAKGREKIRALLFGMIESVSDTEIAKDLNTSELYALLDEKGYKVEEVEQMAKSSLRKINDRYGKNNEILDGQISGIIQSKSNIDVKEYEKQKSDYETELNEVREKASDLMKNDNAIKSQIAELEGKQIEIDSKERDALSEKRTEIYEKLRKAEENCNKYEVEMLNTKTDINRIEADMDGVEESLENYRSLYKKVQDEVFDENETVCPSCGRPFESDKIDEMKKSFEDGKAKRLKDYKSKGETFSKQMDSLKKKLESANEKHKKAEDSWRKADTKVMELRETLQKIPRNPTITENKEYNENKEKIEELRKKLLQHNDLKLQELSNRESYLISMIKQVVGELAVAERNKELDKQIESLRVEKRQAEIQRAENEKLLDQVKTFVQAKNDLLTSKINEKFSMVDWHLWEYQKNGEIKAVTEPFIDNKPMTSAANGSLVTLAKISICADLQRHFGCKCPIWIDDFTLFSDNTISRMDFDTQLIGLVVTDEKELTIENV